MKCIIVLVLMGLAALAAARPGSIIDLDDFHHDLSIENTVVTGTYSWTSPEGVEFFIKYVADDNGYRVVESNAVPITANGVRADGAQGSFFSSEEFDDRK
ncbi:uncharacterized protein [Panulirus ornatus]|uniref:uncharacterized protein n=1 Tax=Panulirus ornatus TaxID=150431 RepID=UPI003A8B2639